MEHTNATSTETRSAASNRFEGGNLLVRALKDLGVRQIFSVSGGPLNSIYHACAMEGLALRHTRHEAGACFMAEAVSRISGVPGVAAVTLGPGVANAVTPALVAKMASVPLLIIGAQANTRTFDRHAGMSADHIPIMTPVTKWAARVLQTDRIPEYIDMAWRRMWAGSPGPVFLEIPVDVLAAPAQPQARSVARRTASSADLETDAKLAEAVETARRPLVILGNDVRWSRGDLVRLVDTHHLPFATMRLARGAIDEHHPLWAGPGYSPCNASLRAALSEADLIVLLGHTFEFDLDYGKTVSPTATVIQSNVDADLIGRNRHADFGYSCAAGAVIDKLSKMRFASVDRRWVDGVVAAWAKERGAQAAGKTGKHLHPVEAVDAVVAAMPETTVYVTSHGNVDFWADARIRVRSPDCYARAGQAGALGAEIPYGVGATFAKEGAPAVVFVGDGGVGYHVTEIETAVRYGKQVIVVVLDDEKWAAIALPQRSSYGGEYEMDLPRRDWAKVADGLGAMGFRADTGAAIASAVRSVLDSGRSGLIQIAVQSVLSPYMAYISK
ncbi:MAG TPA: thiamine pyrophosphate-binding protein [Aestuariivirgaceae bacterium]|nr:thiamine pyrophosphate-binding protein [Aestuariivirgaceae bacterium]